MTVTDDNSAVQLRSSQFSVTVISSDHNMHWGKADDRNCNYGHPKMADVESGKNFFVD
jgi:hypothetical protein